MYKMVVGLERGNYDLVGKSRKIGLIEKFKIGSAYVKLKMFDLKHAK